jgi:phosphoinositide-3-kinase regulatory subunit 4
MCSIQPYLAGIEKKWIAFQLLTCLRDARTRKVSSLSYYRPKLNKQVGHGDIKSENVLVTSDLSVILTDFSSAFKPIYLPLDDPSDFSFFFDTSARRTCYIAPERFYAAESEIAKKRPRRDGKEEEIGTREKVTEEMDVFSCGCVLAELWTDGRAVFNLSELFAYRAGTLGLEGLLDNIDDVHVRVSFGTVSYRIMLTSVGYDQSDVESESR